MPFNRPRVRLVDEVVDELRDRILRGDYPPGSRLLQEQVARDLDLSRTPIREAMRTLEHEGLLVPERFGGVRVAERSPRTLVAAYELREVIDGLAARLAAKAGGERFYRDLQAAMDEQRALLEGEWSPEEWTHANTRFHGLIIDASQNPYLRSLLPFVRTTSQVFRPMSVLGRDRAESAYAEHQTIAQALFEHDVARAEALARAHIHGTAEALSLDLSQEPSEDPDSKRSNP